jgi:predicted Zn finger-like uncharacterized protein
MKFLCPNCKAKYRIGPEKMVGRQAAKIRCRKCEFLIQIAYRGGSDEFDVTATPPSIPPPGPVPAPRQLKGTTGQPVIAPVPPPNVAPRARATGSFGAAGKDEGSGSRKPTAAVPGLPGLGSPKSTRGAALLSDAGALPRRPLAPLPPPPVPPAANTAAALAATSAPVAAGVTATIAAVQPSAAAPGSAVPPPSPRAAAGSTQLADQFRESVQAGGAAEDLPEDGWFVGVNGVPLGPIPLGDLRELAMAGHIDRRSLVWREGQGEWRPLGKFAGLARVIDDGAGPPATPQPEPASDPAPAAAARSNGAAANGHIATGFDVVRADAGGRPSAWGDLDDDDDEDEQPTTVKGRVSVLPNTAAGAPSTAAAPGASEPAAAAAPLGGTRGDLPQSTSNPFGLTSSVVAAPTGASSGGMAASAMAAPHGAPEGAGSMSMLDPASEAGVDADVGMMRSSGRGRWYLILAAIVFAFALGVAIAAHLMGGSSTAERPGKKTSSLRSTDRLPASEPKSREPAIGRAEEELPPAAPDEIPVPARNAPDRGRALLEPSGAAVAIAPAPAGGEPRLTATSALLAGLGSPQASGPALDKPEERVGASGLDATTIQRTVRRYSPGVRQNCWLRALNTRAPGVPSSAKVSATITVDASGRVLDVSVSGAPRGYPGLGRCIEGNVKGWQFPRAAGQTITNVPFVFVGQ